jgi:hypothetical protein
METQNTQLKKAFWILGGLMFVVGLIGWYGRLAHGHTNAAYGNIVGLMCNQSTLGG